MRQTLFAVLVTISFATYAQKEPPGLIYSCEKKDNGSSRYDIFNSSGERILGHSVDWAYSNTWSWLFVVDPKTKLVTVYNYKGQKLDMDSIEESQSAYLSLNRVGLKRKGKWGFYDKQGKLKIPHIYDEISHFNNNMAAVKSDKDVFMIDTNGVKLAKKYDPKDGNYSFSDDDIAIGMGGEFYNKDFKKITGNGKFGLQDVANNKIIIPVEYDQLSDLKDKFGLITAGKNGKFGLLAFGGQVVIPFEYESVFVLNDYF